MYSYSHNKRVTHSSIYFVASSYIDFITDTIPSSTPNFRKAHHTTSLETLSKAFSKSTKAIHRSFFLAKYFSCCCLTTNMASVVPLPAINPNCMSSTFTIRLTLPSITLSRIFITCSSDFIPLYEPHSRESPLSLINIHHPTFTPVIWYFTFLHHCIAYISHPRRAWYSRCLYHISYHSCRTRCFITFHFQYCFVYFFISYLFTWPT